MLKVVRVSLSAMAFAGAIAANAAQLSTDARAVIPHDVQQLVVIDYRALQNSIVGTDMRDRVIPPGLKQFEDALAKSGLDSNHDVDQLAFALISSRGSDDRPMTIGIAQGQFSVQDIVASFRKQKIKAAVVGTSKLYPLPKTGMVVCFLDSSTMLFGGFNAVKKALEARDGMSASLLTNEPMMDAMKTVDSEALWSILDGKGTQAMVRQMMGEAGSVTDFDTVRKRLLASSYSMNFQHGVKFELSLSTGDTFTAATLSSLLSAAVQVRKMSASDAEKQALNETSIDADAGGRLSLRFAASDSEFSSLLHSPLFQSMTQ